MMGIPFNSFTKDERLDLQGFLWMAEKTGVPLSGYLAGKPWGGDRVVDLEQAWATIFKVRHAIAVNSATSGLLAAAFAAGLDYHSTFLCPAMTMSATAAAPCFTGAKPIFGDISAKDFALDARTEIPDDCRAVFVTNLFGNPGWLDLWRSIAATKNLVMIEDNSQSPFATEYGRYAGTVGHIGVFSLNVHKPLQCGEGGMIVTDDDDLADRMRAFINHGEHTTDNIGLNLRMPELCAVVALTQLQRSPSILAQRRVQAMEIIDSIGFIPGLQPPMVRSDCESVYYTIPFVIDRSRGKFCETLREEGVPVVEGYVEPLYRMTAFRKYTTGEPKCLVAEEMHDKRLFYIENCAHSFSSKETRKIGRAFHKAAKTVKL